MRTLHTSRLTLEPQLAAHAAEMFVVLSDPAIYEYENEPPVSEEALRARYAYLEGRRSPDGTQQWLNWVVRLRASEVGVARVRQGDTEPRNVPAGTLVGYVQATVHADARAAVAYEFASAFWHRGLAAEAARAMIDELVAQYGVQRLSAVLKARNLRSRRLLERLGFAPAAAAERARLGVDPDELLMERAAAVDRG